MTRLARVVGSTLAVVGWAAVTLHAHHSFAAEYDRNAPITISGVVSKVSWVNPHSYVYVDVKDSSGTVVTWAAEGFPVAALRRQGLARDSVKVGDTVTVVGWRAIKPERRLAGSELRLPDGRTVPFGPTP